MASLLALGLGVSSAEAVEPKVVVQDHDGSPTALDVSWTDVKGAAAYRVRYSTDDDLKKSVQSIPDVSKGTEATISGLDTNDTYYVQVTALDDKGATLGDSAVIQASTTYHYAAPGDVYATKVTDKTMTLSWKSVGDDVGYLVKISGNGKSHTLSTDKASIKIENTKPETAYAVKVRAAKGGAAVSEYSPSQNFTSSGYTTAAPDHLNEGKQQARSFALSWDGVDGLDDDQGYVVQWSKSTDFKKSSTSKTINGTKTTIGGLQVDMTYYARIWVVNASGKRISEMSDFITTKTIVWRGTLSGDVSGAPSGDLMAVAYDSKKNAALQVPVSDGHYELDVRPGKYKVQILYVGNNDDAAYVSTFAHTGGSGWVMSQGKTYTVETNETTKVTDVDIKHGNVVSGTVASGKTKIRAVDVTAISGVDPTNSHAEREVIGMARTDSNGKFTIAGLADGPYWFRFHYVGSGKGYKTRSDHLHVNKDLGLKVTLKKK